jgi:hypothetical protein
MINVRDWDISFPNVAPSRSNAFCTTAMLIWDRVRKVISDSVFKVACDPAS